MRTAGGAVLAGRHAGGGDRCFTDASDESFGAAAPVEAHALTAVLTKSVTLNGLYLATSSLPSTDTCALIDVYTSPPILTGRSAKGQKALGAVVVRGTLAGTGPHAATTVSTQQLTHGCVAAVSGPARRTQTLVPAHASASVGTGRGAHG